MTDAERHNEALADRLTTAGWLKSRDVRAALMAAPRHLFIPAVALVSPPEGDYLVDHGQDAGAWLDGAYSDHPIVTQLDDGAVEVGSGTGDFTSSCSAPGTVVALLELLGAEPGHRALEIGTGTGWTAGLLSFLVADENVTSIEIDQMVLAAAAESLKEASLSPRLVLGDGAKGWPQGAPYDRVHVTCGVREIPYAWVGQTRPGGAVVLPYSPGFGYSHQLRLVVMPDGSAVGRFPGYASYMMMRSQRQPELDYGDLEIARSVTRVDPRTIAFAAPGADLAMSARLGDVFSQTSQEDGRVTLWLWSPQGPWAIATYEPGMDTYEVQQAGDRALWDEAVSAFLQWAAWGEPGRDRFGMTITPETRRVWLDEPQNDL